MAFPLVRSSQFDVENALFLDYNLNGNITTLALMEFENMVTVPHRFNIGKVKAVVAWVESKGSGTVVVPEFFPCMASADLSSDRSPVIGIDITGAGQNAVPILGGTTFANSGFVTATGFTTKGAVFIWSVPQHFKYDEKYTYFGGTFTGNFSTTNDSVNISAYLVDQDSISVYDEFKKVVTVP